MIGRLTVQEEEDREDEEKGRIEAIVIEEMEDNSNSNLVWECAEREIADQNAD